MKIISEAPTVTTDDRGVTTESHPAFATIGASRISATPGNYLFGSDFKHSHYVVVRVKKATVRRDLSHDWIHGGIEEYIEVALSEAQWASFVSSMNMGDGVACTLTALDRKQVPSITPPTDRREQFKAELSETMRDARNLLKVLSEKIDSSKLSAAQRHDLGMLIQRISNEIGANVSFVAEAFGEHVETVTEKAKIEVAAYLSQMIHRSGVKALSGDAEAKSPLMLEEGEKQVDE